MATGEAERDTGPRVRSIFLPPPQGEGIGHPLPARAGVPSYTQVTTEQETSGASSARSRTESSPSLIINYPRRVPSAPHIPVMTIRRGVIGIVR